MSGFIQNQWREGGPGYERAVILAAATAPEGLDAERIRFSGAGVWSPSQEAGHFVSVLRGTAAMELGAERLSLATDVHLFLPLGSQVKIAGTVGTELVHVAGSRVRGERLLVRDEKFLRGCAEADQSLRWILTPQYLSRRVFLHHDPTLLSKAGDPVSWFRTTMFDTGGLMPNQDGESVFRMSYNSRTEFNICYDVQGEARVRRAKHPYRADGQAWAPWLRIDGETTYHLDEARGGPEEEHVNGGCLRNRHEVYAAGGHTTLFCLFDPAPTGVERHRPGEYSDYEPLERIPQDLVRRHREASQLYDRMVDALSLARARGAPEEQLPGELFGLYQEGLAVQRKIESELCDRLQAQGKGRDHVVRPWLCHEAKPTAQ